MSASGDPRVVVVTGASSGVGKAAAKALAAKGWRVIGIGRDKDRCAAAETETRAAAKGAAVHIIRADLSLLAETARAAEQILRMTDRLDALLNNAGGVTATRIVTREGYEQTFASNHLAPFLLTQRLLPLLRNTAKLRGAGAVRVVGVSSTGHEQCRSINWDDLTFSGFESGRAYCQAKLANILFARELARRVATDGIVSHAMHPGVVDSNFAEHCESGMKAYMRSIMDRSVTPEAAADTLVWLASDPEPGRTNGLYFHNRLAIDPSSAAQDDAAAARLWTVSEAIVAKVL